MPIEFYITNKQDKLPEFHPSTLQQLLTVQQQFQLKFVQQSSNFTHNITINQIHYNINESPQLNFKKLQISQNFNYGLHAHAGQ